MVGVYFYESDEFDEDDDCLDDELDRDISIAGGGFSSWDDFWRYKEG